MTTLSTQWFRFLALAMAAVVYVGAPLMLLSGQPWALPLLTAAVVFPAVGLIAWVLTLLRDTRIPRPVVVLSTAGVVGVVAGLLIFSPVSFGLFGLLVCVPIALAAATVGLIMEWVMIRVPPLALLAVIVGGTLLVSSVIGIVTQEP